MKESVSKGLPGAKELARSLGVAAPGVEAQTSQMERFAVFLGFSGSAVKAADLAGVELQGADLEEYADVARSEYPDLIAGKQTAATALGNAALLLLLIRVRDVAHSLPPAQAAAALRQVGDVLDRLQGGMQPVYSEIRVTLAKDNDG